MVENSSLKQEEGISHCPSGMIDSMEPLAQMVEAFLSTRDRKAHGRGDVVFSYTSVEGSGKGVGRLEQPMSARAGSFTITRFSLYRFKQLLQFKRRPNL